MVQVGVNNWLLGQFRAHIWRKLGSKSGSWTILEAKKHKRQARHLQGGVVCFCPSRLFPFLPQKINFDIRFGVAFFVIFGVIFWLIFFIASGAISGPMWASFWGSRTVQEEFQEESKSNQDECAAENATKAKTCVSPRRELTFWVLEWPKTRLS